MALNNRNNNNLVLGETNSLYKWIVKLPFRAYFMDSKKDFGLLRPKIRFFLNFDTKLSYFFLYFCLRKFKN